MFLCRVSFMLSVANYAYMQSVIVLIVVAPINYSWVHFLHALITLYSPWWYWSQLSKISADRISHSFSVTLGPQRNLLLNSYQQLRKRYCLYQFAEYVPPSSLFFVDDAFSFWMFHLFIYHFWKVNLIFLRFFCWN